MRGIRFALALFLCSSGATAETAGPMDGGPIILGSRLATSTIELYFSPSCPHCAIVYRNIFDDGEIDIDYDNVTLDEAFRAGEYNVQLFPVYFGDLTAQKRSLWADMVARCSADYGEAMWRIISSQEAWLFALHPRALFREEFRNRPLTVDENQAVQVFRTLLVPDLLSTEEFDTCLQNQDLLTKLLRSHEEFSADLAGVPLAVVAGNEVVSPESISAAIREMIAGNR